MRVQQASFQPSAKGSAEYFTGTVRVDSPFTRSGQFSGATVTFEPGARTAWHTHPLGQILLVVSGQGLVGLWQGEMREIRPGDVVFFKPGEKHWHGASVDCAMSHTAIAEMQDGKVVDWLEQVSDEDYAKEIAR